MSNLNENEAATPEVFELQTDDSSNTSANNANMDSSDESNNEKNSEKGSDEGSDNEISDENSSEEVVNAKVGNIPIAIPFSNPSTSTSIPIAQTSWPLSASFKSLTIPVVVLVNPSSTSTMYAGVTSTGFSIHDLARKTPNLRESPSDVDFALKNNIAERFDLSCMRDLVDPKKYRIKIIPNVVSMSDYFIPVPISHFMNGLRFPLDPAFAFFFNLIQA